MKHKIIKLIAGSLLMIWCGIVFAALPLPKDLVGLDTLLGKKYLTESDNKELFIPMISQFVTQDNDAFCGVASSVMLLNTLDVPAPVDSKHLPYHFFTQDNIFTPEVVTISPQENIAHKGMTIAILEKILNVFHLKTILTYANNVSLEQFRKMLVSEMKQPQTLVIANYSRATLGQVGNGHISPIVAYNKEADSFLVLDVARYKYSPYWVKAKDLWLSMRTIDTESNKSRGFIIVSK